MRTFTFLVMQYCCLVDVVCAIMQQILSSPGGGVGGSCGEENPCDLQNLMQHTVVFEVTFMYIKVAFGALIRNNVNALYRTFVIL